MTPLGRDTITVYGESADRTQPDKLGRPKVTETATVQTGCSVERLTESESQSNTDRTYTHRSVYAPPTDLILAMTTSTEIGWNNERYQIFGDIDPQTDMRGRIDHVYFVIRKAAG